MWSRSGKGLIKESPWSLFYLWEFFDATIPVYVWYYWTSKDRSLSFCAYSQIKRHISLRQSFKDDMHFQQVGYIVSCVLMTSVANFLSFRSCFWNFQFRDWRIMALTRWYMYSRECFCRDGSVSTVAISGFVKPKNLCSISDIRIILFLSIKSILLPESTQPLIQCVRWGHEVNNTCNLYRALPQILCKSSWHNEVYRNIYSAYIKICLEIWIKVPHENF